MARGNEKKARKIWARMSPSERQRLRQFFGWRTRLDSEFETFTPPLLAGFRSGDNMGGLKIPANAKAARA